MRPQIKTLNWAQWSSNESRDKSEIKNVEFLKQINFNKEIKMKTEFEFINM